jgi:hypothetical protein
MHEASKESLAPQRRGVQRCDDAAENPIAILGGDPDVVAVCPAEEFRIEHAAETMQLCGKLKPLGRNHSERSELRAGLRSRMGGS